MFHLGWDFLMYALAFSDNFNKWPGNPFYYQSGKLLALVQSATEIHTCRRPQSEILLFRGAPCHWATVALRCLSQRYFSSIPLHSHCSIFSVSEVNGLSVWWFSKFWGQQEPCVLPCPACWIQVVAGDFADWLTFNGVCQVLCFHFMKSLFSNWVRLCPHPWDAAIAVQDLNLRPLCELLPAEWNAPSRPVSMLDWLSHQRSDEHENRLHALGNIVVPQQAVVGFQALLMMFVAKRSQIWA